MSYSINGVTMPPIEQGSLDVERTDLFGESTGRDETGAMHLDLVRSGVYKVTVEHRMLTNSQVVQIENSIRNIPFSFSCSTARGNVSFSAYASAPKLKQVVQGRWDMSFSAIEI